MGGHILIVEDRESLRRMLQRALTGEGYRVTAAADGEAAVEHLGRDGYDLVLTDLKLPGVSGLEVLAASRAAQPDTPVVVLTGYGTVGTAVEAMKLGALDFLEKPVELEELFRLTAGAVGGDEAEAGTDDIPFCLAPPGAPPVVGRHPKMRAAARLLTRVADKGSTVLLTGESGTGKELFARGLHALSPRRDGPFVAVNCAAIPESLMENELFGHEKGAFTGADRRRPGRFEAATGGTLFLDEVGELAPSVQGKVLRVLEERTYERVGGSRTLSADVRLVAATNRPLQRMVEEGLFRSDLYFRLNVFPIELPPLAERTSDVPALARHLVAQLAERHGVEPPTLTPEALELLAAQPWPGNVRQLGNVLERAVILAEEPRLGAADLEPLVGAAMGRSDEPGADATNPEPAAGAGGDDRESLRRALVAADGDKRRAAEMLGVSYRTLQRRVHEHDLEGVPRYRSGLP